MQWNRKTEQKWAIQIAQMLKSAIKQWQDNYNDNKVHTLANTSTSQNDYLK